MSTYCPRHLTGVLSVSPHKALWSEVIISTADEETEAQKRGDLPKVTHLSVGSDPFLPEPVPTSSAPGSQVHCPGFCPSLNNSRVESLPPTSAHTPLPPPPPTPSKKRFCLLGLSGEKDAQTDGQTAQRRIVPPLAAPAPLPLNCHEVGLR